MRSYPVPHPPTNPDVPYGAFCPLAVAVGAVLVMAVHGLVWFAWRYSE
jgi:hypothetical protein